MASLRMANISLCSSASDQVDILGASVVVCENAVLSCRGLTGRRSLNEDVLQVNDETAEILGLLVGGNSETIGLMSERTGDEQGKERGT